MGKPHAHRHADEGLMSLTVCLAPANTMAYPNGGGHLWVYLQWSLGLKALGCRVIWLEVLDPGKPLDRTKADVAALRERLGRYSLAQSLALCPPNGGPLPQYLAARV